MPCGQFAKECEYGQLEEKFIRSCYEGFELIEYEDKAENVCVGCIFPNCLECN